MLASKVGLVKAELMGAKIVILTFGAARELVYPVFCTRGAPQHRQADYVGFSAFKMQTFLHRSRQICCYQDEGLPSQSYTQLHWPKIARGLKAGPARRC